jgi:hypothetical protein
MVWARLVSLSTDRLTKATAIPASAKAKAVALPIPLLAPVMIALRRGEEEVIVTDLNWLLKFNNDYLISSLYLLQFKLDLT